MDMVTRGRKELAFIAVALLLAYGIYQTAGVALNTEVPVVAVTSPSMEPALERGDMVVVNGKPFDQIREGDIIVFDPETECLPVPIIHRVVNASADTLDTKGDNNPSQLVICQGSGGCSQTFNSCPASAERFAVEEGITEDQVKGVVSFTVPKLGFVKLVPTCTYLKISGQPVSPTICP